MIARLTLFILQAALLEVALSLPVPFPGFGNGLLANNMYNNPLSPTLVPGLPTVAAGSAVTTVTSLPINGLATSVFPEYAPVQTTQVTPLVTEIVPALQFGDITVTGDMPIGGTIKVSGCFPVYGTVAVDGTMPSAGTAIINTGGGFVTQVIEPACRCGGIL
ncbi:uncharacterized protein LOC115441634 [Manduca sexta]|uniref:uncharacterized protein LOC115441634 n=1 Tax=Manduca sexta TaxID=7130 RepID=UPI00188E05C0|nr:uncharacterized protein LOC115441634 [Manduca sexta]